MVVVRLKARGQLTVPRAIRERLGLREGDLLRLSVEEGRLVLEPLRAPRPEPIWVPAEKLRALAGAVALGGNALEDTEEYDQ